MVAAVAVPPVWTKVDSIKEVPKGEWIVEMSDGSKGYCKVSNPDFAVINGAFYFDRKPVVAYIAIPERKD